MNDPSLYQMDMDASVGVVGCVSLVRSPMVFVL